MNKVLEEISKIGIVPVIALDHTEDAAPLAKASCNARSTCPTARRYDSPQHAITPLQAAAFNALTRKAPKTILTR